MGPPYYRMPVMPEGNIDDPGYSNFLVTGNIAFLQWPLVNETEYRAAEKYWTSNWRTYDNPLINGVFFPDILPGEYGPHWDAPLYHRTSYESAFPTFDPDTGIVDTMNPYRVDGVLNTSPAPPSSDVPKKSKWSVMDICYEMQEIVFTVDSFCENAPEMKAKWLDTLRLLGIGQYMTNHGVDATYMWDHSADYKINSDPVVFGTEIVQMIFGPMKELQDEYNAKIAELQALINTIT
jgi:hypothetical protein